MSAESRQRRRREAVRAMLRRVLGTRCEACGATENLWVVSRKPGRKAFDFNRDASRSMDFLISKTKDHVVCCRWCEGKRRRTPHSASGYGRGCRCRVCKDAMRASQRKCAAGSAERLQKGLLSHGSTAYNYGCRCEICRAVHSTRMKARKRGARG
jgi:hypothetical protein